MKIERASWLLATTLVILCGVVEERVVAYTLTVTANHGSVAVNPNKPQYGEGEKVRLVPRPNIGYCFGGWSGDAHGSRLVMDITMEGNMSVTANFVTWTPPIGIPTPSFGITQSYRMYDTPGNRNGNLAYYESPSSGYYTHYVDNTDPNATDSGNTYGTVKTPRLTVPVDLPAGSVVEVHGTLYTYSNGPSGEVLLSGVGTTERPVFIRGVGSPRFSKTFSIGYYGSTQYFIMEGLSGFGCVISTRPDPIVLDTEYLCIRGCEFYGNENGGGIQIASYSANKIEQIVLHGNAIHDNGVWDPNIAVGDQDTHGIVVNGGVSYLWVVDNEIYHNSGDGMQVNSYTDHHVYAGRNQSHDNKQAGFGTKTSQDIIYSQNMLYGGRYSSSSQGAGLYVQYDPNRVWLLFNDVYDSELGIVIGGADLGGGGNFYVIGNLIHHIHTDNPNGWEMGKAFASWDSYGVTILNNTIYDTDGGALYKSRDKFVFKNNIVYDFTDAQAITLENNQNNDISHNLIATDPAFADPPNDFHLQATSSAIDAGTSSGVVAEVCNRFQELYGIDIRKDIEGTPRPPGTAWDIGAYEYTLRAITGLAVSGTSQNSVTLTWTVPGEQGVTGQPAGYDIRCSSNSLTEANWNAATQVQGEPVPGAFGAAQSFTVTGLNPGTTYYIAIKVLDQAGHASALSNAVSGTTATSGNRAPVLQPIGDRSVVETATITFSISATDADGDTLTYSAANLPTGANFTAATRTFAWTPTNLQSGRYRVMFQVSDTHVTVSETITITVREGSNQPPVLAAIGGKSVNENASLSFSLSATDPDGDSLTFSATGLPSGASFADGIFNWTPSYDQAGSYPVTFTVSDGELMDSEQITITVADVSDRTPPSAQAVYPAVAAIQVPLNPLIVLTISDVGSGIEASTVAIRVNDQLVYSGGNSLYESAYGTCRRTGTRASYHYYYQPANAFDFDQHVTVLANASDAANNAMTPLSHQFTTQMRSFGQNQPVSSESDTSGRPAVATDSQGNLWAAWHAGQVNARDIYVAKRGSQLQQWNTPLRLTSLASDRCNPALAVGPDNALYLAWQDNRRGNWDVYVSVSQDGSTWGDPIRVTDSNDTQVNPVIAVDQASPYHVYIAWERGNAGSRDIYLASCSSSFVSKTIAQVTSDPADQAEPALAVGSDNTVYVLWTDQRNGSADIYGSSSAASSWSNGAVVTGPGNQSHPAVAAAPGTSVLHVVWQSDATGNLDVLYGTSNGLPASPLAGSSLIDDTTNADQSAPTIVAAKDHWNNNHVYACWQDNRVVGNTHDSDLYVTEIRSGTGGTNILVGDDGTNSNQSDPALGCDEYGQPAIVWMDSRGGTPRIYSACSVYAEPVAVASALITRTAGGRVGVDPASIDDVGDVSIQIPPTAYDCDVAISISEIQNLPRFTSPSIAGYEISPSGVQFAFPATVTIPYTDSNPCQRTPYWYDAQTGTLSQQGMTDITYRTLANGISVVSFKTNHLTTFYILENPLPRGGGGGGGGCAMSNSQEGNIIEFLLPFAVLVPFLYVWKRRDRRQKEVSKNISSP
jgi:hypothetical protein